MAPPPPAAARYPSLWAFLSHADESYHTDLPFGDVRAALLTWYRVSRRRLPWRGDLPPYTGSTAGMARAGAEARAPAPPRGADAGAPANPVSPYGVWVSEVMCQQTRVEAVIPYWLAWMEAFPTVQALAEATEEQVNARWAGLGFYRRARMLHNGSKQVLGEFRGELPRTLEELRSLRGVGPYTAGAVASICFGEPAPIVDGNVLRVLARLCAVAAHPQQPAFCAEGRLAWQLAEKLVKADGGAHAGELNQAIMELGATLCAPSGTGADPRDPLGPFYKSTKIGADALQARRDGALEALLGAAGHGVFSCPACAAGAGAYLEGLRAAGTEEAAAAQAHLLLPLPPPRKARREERLVVLALRREPVPGEQGPAWLLWRRAGAGLLAGQWEFPCALVAQHLGAPPEDPGPEARGAAASALLRELGAEEGLSGRESLPGPLEHVFSHVRHIMHVERALVPEGAALAASGAGAEFRRGERRLCWMGVGHMADVGVTAAVRKVLGEVASRLGPEAASAETPPGRKRRRAAVAGGARPKRSAPGGVRGAGEGKGERQQQLSFTKPLRACADAGGCIDVDSGDAAE